MEHPVLSVIAMIVFALAACALKWLCTELHMPAPVLWIGGALLLFILLHWLSAHSGMIGASRGGS